MDLAVAKLIELKRLKDLSNDDIARVCGVSKQAVSNVFKDSERNVPAYWLYQLIDAYELDANYFFRKKAPLQQYAEPESEASQAIPLLGNIAAGFNKNSEEMLSAMFHVPNFMIPKKKQCFALQVSGDSMIEAGILDGDICIIERQDNPSLLKSGDIAAFRIDGDATLKYYHKENGQVWLASGKSKLQANTTIGKL